MPRVRVGRGANSGPVNRTSFPGRLHGVSESQRHRRHEHNERPRLPGSAQSAGDHGQRVAHVRQERVPERSDRAQAQERDHGPRDRRVGLGLDAAHGGRGQHAAVGTGGPMRQLEHRRPNYIREWHQHGWSAAGGLSKSDKEHETLDSRSSSRCAVSARGRSAH